MSQRTTFKQVKEGMDYTASSIPIPYYRGATAKKVVTCYAYSQEDADRALACYLEGLSVARDVDARIDLVLKIKEDYGAAVTAMSV